MQRYLVEQQPYTCQKHLPRVPAKSPLFSLKRTLFLLLLFDRPQFSSIMDPSLSLSTMARRPRSPEIKQSPPATAPKPPRPAPPVVSLDRSSCHVAASAGCSGGFSLRNLLVHNSGAACMPNASEGELRRPRAGKQPAAEGVAGSARCMGGKKVEGIRWGSQMTIGGREAMEDYFANVRGLMKLSCREFGGCVAPQSDHAGKKVPLFYFGVFDGHRGHQVSEYCANVLHFTVAEEWEKQASEDVVGWSERWNIAFSRAFERADEIFRSRTLEVRFAGSTACVVVVSPCQIVASNCGDSKAILCRSNEVVPLTFDHKPNRKEEVDRIEKIGGKIFRVNGLRVEGVLAMTRAIGDHDLKPFVISTPDVTYTRRSDEDECLVLATDGLWDVMSTDIVAKLAVNRLRVYRSVGTSALTPAAAVAEDLLHKALANHSKDNITVTVVDLKPLWKSNRCS